GSTSFFPAKPLGCYGDGGALFTDDPKLDELFRTLRVHGGLKRGHFTHIGMTGRLDTLQAAVLNAKLPHFPREIALRKEAAERYDALLGDLCAIPQIDEGCVSTYAMYTIRIEERDKVAAALKEAGIPYGVYYDKVAYEQPAYQYLGVKKSACPVSERLGSEVISLPMHPWLQAADQERIADVIRKAKSKVAPV
ncbi:MAG: DegT/DnrJ/EryC1/StrS family aminotransferase, partial [Chlamydiia bacterium]|nr:DegT/DnrJ/EryC1/StrS family aminotransferase [Chlamydiia bacterium]